MEVVEVLDTSSTSMHLHLPRTSTDVGQCTCVGLFEKRSREQIRTPHAVSLIRTQNQ